MKKVLFGLLALSCVAMAKDTNLYFRTGVDLNGKYDEVNYYRTNLNSENTDETPWELSLEATKYFTPNWELGLGVAYQDHRTPKDGRNGHLPGYDSIPVYALAKYNFETTSEFKPFFKTSLGYSFNSLDGDVKYNNQTYSSSIKDSLYFGMGVGVEYQNFIVDLMYQLNRGDLNYQLESNQRLKDTYDYSRVTLSFGYKFEF